ncbi:MAG: hypothetical protein ACXVAX_00130 [Pseudobdellovibrio sp.]
MFAKFVLFILMSCGVHAAFAASNEVEARKTHIEDIFIWKMSDELKLSVTEEKEFTEVSHQLNKKKFELNKKIQDLIQALNENSNDAELKEYKKLLQQYNQISITEYDKIKKILGVKKFISYLKIKNELNSKMKSILAGEKTEKKENADKALPSPKVIVEKPE